ncbi:hypothetical protein K505DRAFT_368322 [Melanomma pulvis-pyrius CBS 109.77]|uniref:Uncharacterized protein n=1 Tax=Melanomma pulvis-pyrius CBS 109.77 TaxID=1314802 RepID=A0A6A6WQX1_9PLEO|nr:hypothetical protein K505DRAFT_368322 [Melanomma pulvis-pyrius CBS 109.77]
MLIYQIVPTTPRLEELIYLVAASTSKNNGHIEYSADGGKTFVYDKSDESMALGREYFDNLWSTVQRAVTGVKLEKPERRPTVLRLEKGRLVIHDVGVIIPIRSCNDTFEQDNIDIKSGDDHYSTRLAPQTIIVISGGLSEDVSVEISARVPFDLILHPKSPLTAPKGSAT